MARAKGQPLLNRGQQIGLALFLMTMLFLAEAWPQVAPGGTPRPSDFEIFRMVGRLFWQGNVADAYDFERFRQIQFELRGTREMLLFGYPPPYILFLAPLGLAASGVDWLLFMAPALALFLWCIVRLAGAHAGLAVLLAMLPCHVALISGQNGLITGALVGLACLGLRSGKAIAGLPLGLMIIKPQLALGLGLYLLVRREFATLIVAALTALAAAGLATAVLGPAIWPAFLAGVREQGALLTAGFFPVHRMQSPFALALSLGRADTAAWGVHAAAALAALAGIALAARRLPPATALGIAVLGSAQLSPYMFDYDLPVVMVGAALLLAPLRAALARKGASGWLIHGAWLACVPAAAINGLVQISQAGSLPAAQRPPAWGAVLMIAAFWLAALPLLRQGARAQ